jgi:O-antigen ligase
MKTTAGLLLRASLVGLRRRIDPRVLPVSYTAALCLVYVMHNIWAARTVYDFVVLPVALVSIRRREWLPIVKDPAFLAAAGYFAGLALAGLAAPDRHAAILVHHFEESLLVLSLLVVTAILVRRGGERFVTTAFLILAVAAAAAALLNVVVYYRDLPVDQFWTTRLQGIPGVTMYYNSNVVGDVYAIAFAAAAALLAQGRLRVLPAALAALAAAILLGTVLLSGSRGALLGAAAASCVLLALCGSWRWRIAILGTVLGGLLLLVCLRLPLPMDILARADSKRLSLWPAYLRLAAARPWLGYGLSFDTTIRLNDGFAILNPHNIVLAALIRGGIVSALPLLAVLVLSVHRAWRGWVGAGTPLALAMMAACILITVVDHEFLASPIGFHWLLLWLPVGISIGVAGMVQSPPSPTVPPIREWPGRPEESSDPPRR